MRGRGRHLKARRSSVVAVVSVALATLALVVAGGTGSHRTSSAQAADTIRAGFDLFETDPEQTVFRFRDKTAIPANFFAPGSEKFEGDVPFGGVPIERFRSKDTGDADTVVQRKENATIPASGSSKPIGIELVRLSLVSVAPIDVKVGNTTQVWDVRAGVSASRPSTGRMSLARRGNGGTFDSILTVYPKFTFTRLPERELHKSQAQTKVLDVGALPNGVRPGDQDLSFTALGVPWRRGCAPPALHIPGLNDSFCPGLALGGGDANGQEPGNLPSDAHKVLTNHQSTYANHGIWPVQPRLEHFVCYTTHALAPPVFPASVRLRDQFASSYKTLNISRPERFCNPARKRQEPFKNRKAHLRCYGLTNPSLDRIVLLRNQFGPFFARVLKPERLCLPSTKQVVGQPPPQLPIFVTEHFECYRIAPLGTGYKSRKVKFEDQFTTFKVKVFKPSRLCTPVSKTPKIPVQHTVRHLVCYPVHGPALTRSIIVRNQFTEHRHPKKPDQLETRRVREVCVPTIKWKFP